MTGGPGATRNSVRRRGSLDPMAAVLVRRIPVKVRNVSPMGCLLECTDGVPVGVSGYLSLEVNGAVFSDDVRVVRCQTFAGAAPHCRVGVEILSTRSLSRTSLRRVILDAMLGASPDAGALPGGVVQVEAVVKSKRRSENHTARPPPDDS
jgi:hypothetical protein